MSSRLTTTTTMRARARRGAALLLAAALLGSGVLAGCRSQPPMLQPVAPVPTVTPGDSGG